MTLHIQHTPLTSFESSVIILLDKIQIARDVRTRASLTRFGRIDCTLVILLEMHLLYWR